MSGVINSAGSKSHIIGHKPSGTVLGITHVGAPSTATETIGATFEYLDGKTVNYTVLGTGSTIKVEWNMHLQLNTKTSVYGVVLELRHSADSYGTALRGASLGSGSQHIHYGVSTALVDPVYLQYMAPLVGIHVHGQAAGTVIAYRIWAKGSPNGTYTLYSWDTWGDDEQIESVVFTEFMP